MRVFLAVFPPTEAQVAAGRAGAALREVRDGVSWVRPANMHYTLRFLGDLDELSVAAATTAVREAAASTAPFGATLAGLGAFPSAKRARVLWVGMGQGSEAMRRLADTLDTALVRQRFEPPEQPFEPHLTIGRVREPADWTARLVAAAGPEARFTVDQLHVVRSTLARGGSMYERLASSLLVARA